MSGSAEKRQSTFKTVSDGAVKSITQRKLLRYWESIRGTDVLPKWSQIDAAEVASFREHLCVMEVKRESRVVRYRIREHGAKLGEYYGNACAGRHLDEFMTPEALSALCAIYDRAVETRRPVYTVTPMADRRRRSVTCERLLLPFTLSDAAVDVVLTSIE
ncbi:MAG: PAS domain-containing protein, partial [Xanthobacteraceae bacterium]